MNMPEEHAEVVDMDEFVYQSEVRDYVDRNNKEYALQPDKLLTPEDLIDDAQKLRRICSRSTRIKLHRRSLDDYDSAAEQPVVHASESVFGYYRFDNSLQLSELISFCNLHGFLIDHLYYDRCYQTRSMKLSLHRILDEFKKGDTLAIMSFSDIADSYSELLRILSKIHDLNGSIVCGGNRIDFSERGSTTDRLVSEYFFESLRDILGKGDSILVTEDPKDPLATISESELHFFYEYTYYHFLGIKRPNVKTQARQLNISVSKLYKDIQIMKENPVDVDKRLYDLGIIDHRGRKIRKAYSFETMRTIRDLKATKLKETVLELARSHYIADPINDKDKTKTWRYCKVSARTSSTFLYDVVSLLVDSGEFEPDVDKYAKMITWEIATDSRANDKKLLAILDNIINEEISVNVTLHTPYIRCLTSDPGRFFETLNVLMDCQGEFQTNTDFFLQFDNAIVPGGEEYAYTYMNLLESVLTIKQRNSRSPGRQPLQLNNLPDEFFIGYYKIKHYRDLGIPKPDVGDIAKECSTSVPTIYKWLERIKDGTFSERSVSGKLGYISKKYNLKEMQ